MSLIFNPWTEHNVDHEEIRLVFYDIENNSFDKMLIMNKKDGALVLTDEKINNCPWLYKYKYQKKEGTWKDITKYFYLKNTDDNEFENFILDNIEIKTEELSDFVSKWSHQNSVQNKIIGRAVYKFMRNLWTKQHRNSFKNVPILINFVEKNYGFQKSLLGNVLLYLKIYLELIEDFHNLNLSSKPFDELSEILNSNSNIKNVFVNKIKFCEKYSGTLQMANVLCGKLYSLIGDRESAIIAFTKANQFEQDYIQHLNFDQGLYTFIKPEKNIMFNNTIKFDGTPKENNNIVFIISLDTKFLRCYGTQLLFYINVLKKYQFHFHIIGEESEVQSVIQETKELFNLIKKYRNSNSVLVEPNFSTEKIPNNVTDYKTYFASSRYINAQYFLDKYKSDIYIMDADLSITSDPESFINSLKVFDVAIPFSSGISNVCPWRRLLAGNVFIKNSENGRYFLQLIRDYTLDNIYKPQAWTLDQNALSYAYEEVLSSNKQIKIGNCNDYNRPMAQPSINRQIETL